MAAELLLTFAMQETLTRVSSIAAEGIRLAWGLEGQLQTLNKSLTMIQAKLEDAARRPVTDKSVKLWLERLQDVAYDAEGVLDEFAYEILRKDQKKGKVRECFSLHKPFAFRPSMGQKVKKIIEALDEIREDAAGFGLGATSQQHEDRAQEVCWDLDRETDSFLDSSEVVGRDDDVSIVTEKLTSLTKQQHVLSVVPIVGMAGLGKTTVAKKVCEVVRERKHFDVTLWVCVPTDFSKGRILGEMLQEIDKSTGGLNSLDAILRNLKKELENKTFFLVLDDVWNEDHGKWDDLKEQLLKISSKNGNAVVVTTRKTEIATMMETSPGSQHKPRGLLDDECWSIIKQKVSGGGGATLTADFESIGKDIAKKCGGLPLLAKVLGGTLQRKETQEWRSILNSRIWDTEDGKLVPAEVRFLTRLQTLSFFVVGPDHMVEELGCLNELKGELKIYRLEHVRDKEEAKKAKLREKRMDRLVLEWSDEDNSSVNYEGALEGLQPHPDIRSLTISGYGVYVLSSYHACIPVYHLKLLILYKSHFCLISFCILQFSYWFCLTIECAGEFRMLKEAMKWLYEASAEQCLSGWINVRVAFCCLYENG
ncbi:hypothetical protein DKX38_020354 [Salix brachista]|uniref:AAA+ ATPase domain-containing protein n=1 Tax=Salix brachista TaxID=2182728 RepID=A0A5N5KD93_9ROSI|nr:hypothetical protein DKX38_020354 [Salix brachista]